MTLAEATKLTEAGAREHLESIRWPYGRICPHCGSKRSFAMKGESTRAGLYKCSECRKPFTVTVGTIFHSSHIGLREWLIAFHLMCSSKKGISALQLQRNLGIKQYKSAWHMAHRIRHAMDTGTFDGPPLKGIVEVDETYVGGKKRGVGMRAAMANKTAVLSLVERGGKKRSLIVKKVTAKNLRAAVIENVAEGSTIHTDELKAYKNLKDKFTHGSVNHSAGQYVRDFKDGSKITTNTVESSFALLKRGIYGAFHHVSKHHLHRYLAEFDFRWNMRKESDGDRVFASLQNTEGKRLFYKQPKQAAA
jgi:transposase-like protein